MKILCQALQAVTVEFTGILLIVWLVFGCASWGIRTVSSERGDWSHEFSTMLNSVDSQLTEMIPQSPTERQLGILKRT